MRDVQSDNKDSEEDAVKFRHPEGEPLSGPFIEPTSDKTDQPPDSGFIQDEEDIVI